MKVLFISNGHGEDLIACRLIDAMRQQDATFSVSAIAVVGTGQAYRNRSVWLHWATASLPSGGFLRNWRDIFSDLLSGLLKRGWQIRQTAKRVADHVDLIVCVGDVTCLLLGHTRRDKTVFLPTAKSDLFMSHTWIERWLMKRCCRQVYPRDKATETGLSTYGIPAQFLGNPMMDGLPVVPYPSSFTIGLLPGSRSYADQNAGALLEYVEGYRQRYGVAVSVMVIVSDRSLVPSVPKTVRCRSDFSEAIQACSLVLGVAGTANEQAVFMQRPVICMAAHGPQATALRFSEQKKLLGPLLTHVDPVSTDAIAKAIAHWRDHPSPCTPSTAQYAATKIVRDWSNFATIPA